MLLETGRTVALVDELAIRLRAVPGELWVGILPPHGAALPVDASWSFREVDHGTLALGVKPVEVAPLHAADAAWANSPP